MAKHGEPGWRIEAKIHGKWTVCDDPRWIQPPVYRAVRVERQSGNRVPLPWSTIRCGMVVKHVQNIVGTHLVVATGLGEFAYGRFFGNHKDFVLMEYLDGDTWKPLWTEEPGEEKIVEIVSEEEV